METNGHERQHSFTRRTLILWSNKSPEPTAIGAVIKLTSKIVRFPKAEVDAYRVRNFLINARGQETS